MKIDHSLLRQQVRISSSFTTRFFLMQKQPTQNTASTMQYSDARKLHSLAVLYSIVLQLSDNRGKWRVESSVNKWCLRWLVKAGIWVSERFSSTLDPRHNVLQYNTCYNYSMIVLRLFVWIHDHPSCSRPVMCDWIPCWCVLGVVLSEPASSGRHQPGAYVWDSGASEYDRLQ